jgi:hypothetical protein
MKRGKTRYIPVERLEGECGWEDTIVFLVGHWVGNDEFASHWTWVRDCLEAGWMDTWNWNNVVICANESRWAVVYWEGDGPRCISRGERLLLSTS